MLDDLVALARRYGVELVVDVRRYPRSRRVPHFNSEELERSLPAAGIDYLHMPALGGRRKPRPGSPNAGWQHEQFRGYADHMETQEFQAALGRLEALARSRPTAVMCAEASWWRCHRRLIADALLARGWRVLHIGSGGGASEHELTRFAAVTAAGVTYPAEQTSLDL